MESNPFGKRLGGNMENQVLITAYGQDKVGIVRDISKILLDMGCNIQDSAMKLMRGNFVIMMAVSLPDKSVSIEDLNSGFDPVRKNLGLVIETRPFSGSNIKDIYTSERICILTVSGGDKPGIVHAVSVLLSDMDININDISTKLIEYESGENYYISILEIILPPDLSYTRLKENLLALSSELSVDIEIEIMENESI
jgi:glycine cleavage system transcriptional repressor